MQSRFLGSDSPCAATSASQYPCGWPETSRRKGGKIMSIQASTAALDPSCQRLFLPRRVAPRHPASGRMATQLKCRNGRPECRPFQFGLSMTILYGALPRLRRRTRSGISAFGCYHHDAFTCSTGRIISSDSRSFRFFLSLSEPFSRSRQRMLPTRKPFPPPHNRSRKKWRRFPESTALSTLTGRMHRP